jgi:Ulp1 family protease
MEAIIATCGDSEIRIPDYNIFKYNSWLTSNCISFYTEYIKQSIPIERVLIFDTFTIQWYLMEDIEEIASSIMALHLDKFAVICIPINDSSNFKLPGSIHY